MKKIIVLHARHSYNYGAFMMVINFIEYFMKCNGGKRTKFFVDYCAQDDLERLRTETLYKFDIENLEITKVKIKKFHVNFIAALKSRYINQIKELLNYEPDAVVILGGDNLSEYYDGWRVAGELLKIWRISKYAPVFLVGQTVGPFKSWRKKMAACCLKNSNVYLRDDVAYEYAKNEIKLNNAYKFRDLALLDLPRQNDKELFREVLNSRGLAENNFIVLVPSGAHRQYTNSLDDYIESWTKIINNLSAKENLQHTKIVLLSHVSRPDKKSDGRIIRLILEKLDNKTLERIVKIDEELTASEARMILGAGFFTISGRMHSAVSAFQMLKPAIVLSYSVKYDGVIGKGLKMNDLVIEAKNDNLWKGEIADAVCAKTDYLVKNYNEIRETLKMELEKNQDLILKQIRNIVDEIEQL